ncbi:MAG: ankyrin repeat domain-containing protein [Desulfobacterales bacterium]|nr:ankyrin repeat domain-containing protein [Desulfobacterales bacterium]
MTNNPKVIPLLAFIILVVAYGLMGCAAYNAQYPLHGAASEGKSQQVQALIKSGSPIEGRDSAGLTPLMVAASYGQIETFKALVEIGADINTQDSLGMTPLLYAATACQLDMITLLANRGARTDVKAKDGGTAIHYVASYCSKSPEKALAIMNILLEKGADISAVDNDGHTAYWTAISNGYSNMVAFLRRKGVTERFQAGAGSGFAEALRSPSFLTPPPGTYIIPAGQENNYQLAIEDCNHIVVPYKTGLLMAGGPIAYGVGLLVDKGSVPEKYQVCMEKMGFRRTEGVGVLLNPFPEPEAAKSVIGKSIVTKDSPYEKSANGVVQDTRIEPSKPPESLVSEEVDYRYGAFTIVSDPEGAHVIEKNSGEYIGKTPIKVRHFMVDGKKELTVINKTFV